MFGMGGFGDIAGAAGYPGANGGQGFAEQYHCYPVSFEDKEHLEDGDKILLPSSALDSLARLQIEYPMLFEISNTAENKRTHCGVLEFSAPEGSCYIPYWMMQNLLLEAGSLLTVKNKSLPKATFVKFQPQSVDFLDISNPRAVLERQLRQYSCVTQGDIICIPYNAKKYYLEVKEVKPAEAACIIETDCNVDFDAPVGYKEGAPSGAAMGTSGSAIGGGSAAGGNGASSGMRLPPPQTAKAVKEGEPSKPAFEPFAGGGVRLDGKPVTAKAAAADRAAAAGTGAATAAGAAAGAPGRPVSAAAAAAAARAAAAAAAGPAPAPPPVPVAAVRRPSAGKYARRASQTSAFQGSGNSLT
ncbi:unnamed protein product [Phaeothamnion confervicola]